MERAQQHRAAEGPEQRAELLDRAKELFDAISAGKLDMRISATYPLAQAAEAQRALEGRATTGKVLLTI